MQKNRIFKNISHKTSSYSAIVAKFGEIMAYLGKIYVCHAHLKIYVSGAEKISYFGNYSWILLVFGKIMAYVYICIKKKNKTKKPSHL